MLYESVGMEARGQVAPNCNVIDVERMHSQWLYHEMMSDRLIAVQRSRPNITAIPRQLQSVSSSSTLDFKSFSMCLLF